MLNSRSSLKYGVLGLTVLFCIALISAAGRSINLNSPMSAQRTLTKDFDAPVPVRQIIERACLDCHSNETVWPWYSYIPPISMQIHSDVNNARQFMNFSHWSEYTAEEQHDFISQIAYATNARIMPPPRYLWIHRDARLSVADLEALKQWARSRSGGAPLSNPTVR